MLGEAETGRSPLLGVHTHPSTPPFLKRRTSSLLHSAVTKEPVRVFSWLVASLHLWCPKSLFFCIFW